MIMKKLGKTNEKLVIEELLEMWINKKEVNNFITNLK